MRYLPISLDTRDKNILVLGGGYMAYSAIKILAKTEATIYVIAENINDDIKKLADNYEEKRFKLKEQELTENFIFMGYDYLIIATENFEINQAMEKRAIDKKMIYQRCDILSSSTINLNKVLEYGSITVGINNSKINPTITDKVYRDIETLLDSYSLDKLNTLNLIRSELIRKNSQDIDNIIEKLLTEDDKILSDVYKILPIYKIDNGKSMLDLVNAVKNNDSINLEKENTNKEEIIEENIKDFKQLDEDANKEEITEENIDNLDKLEEDCKE